jgi:hypothetical protein
LDLQGDKIAYMQAGLLPGSDLVEEGIRDLEQGVESIPALLVSIGAPKLRMLGLPIPEKVISAPELRLYQKLWRIDPDGAHSKYNALLRRLVSFEHAAECAR